MSATAREGSKATATHTRDGMERCISTGLSERRGRCLSAQPWTGMSTGPASKGVRLRRGGVLRLRDSQRIRSDIASARSGEVAAALEPLSTLQRSDLVQDASVGHPATRFGPFSGVVHAIPFHNLNAHANVERHLCVVATPGSA